MTKSAHDKKRTVIFAEAITAATGHQNTRIADTVIDTEAASSISCNSSCNDDVRPGVRESLDKQSLREEEQKHPTGRRIIRWHLR